MKRSIVVMIGIIFAQAQGIVWARFVGSNTTSSRQVASFFPAADTDNQMLGFSVFEKGMMLESSTTTCICDAFFPVSGNIVLNGGTLSLARDFELKSPYSMGPGKIDGIGKHAISFPGNVTGVSIPSGDHEKLLRLMSTVDAGTAVNSVDWSFDSKYIALARQGASGNEIQIYHMNDFVLTLTNGLDCGSANTLSVRWHPSDYYLAVGRSSGDGVEVYYFNIASGQLQKKSGLALSAVNAVAWRPQGNALAIGRASHADMMVCEVASGILGTSYTATYSSVPGVARAVQKNAVDWDSSGAYIAAGLSASSTDAELKIFSFSGGSLARCAELEVGATVYAAQWHPTLPYLAVGLSSGADRIVLYSFDIGLEALSNVLAQAGVANAVYGLSWDDSGSHLASVTTASSLAYDMNVFAFDMTNLKLNQAAGYRGATTTSAVAWSHGGAALCCGDTGSKLKLFAYSPAPSTFKDINVFINSDINFGGAVIFDGTCLIDGGWNTLTFGADGALVIADGSSLYLENIVIKGITANRIVCAGDSSTLSLRNVVWDQDGLYTFSVGSLRFNNDVLMSGDTTFVYSSARTSTIIAHSDLTLDLDFTFSYDPGVPSKRLIEFEDATSRLSLNGATLHATVTGLQLTKGNVRVLRDSVLESETQVVFDEQVGGNFLIDEGITIGDSSAEFDAALDIYGGVCLQLAQGSLGYKNVSTDSLRLHNVYSSFFIGGNTALRFYENMNIGAGSVVLGDSAILAHGTGKTITGSIQPRGRYYYTEIAS